MTAVHTPASVPAVSYRAPAGDTSGSPVSPAGDTSGFYVSPAGDTSVPPAAEAAHPPFFPRPTVGSTVKATVHSPSATVDPPQAISVGEPSKPTFYTRSDVPSSPHADAYCLRCGAGMTGDEAALNKKYLGRHVTDFLCPACLGERLGLSARDLRAMIEVFRKQGCRLFSPLPD